MAIRAQISPSTGAQQNTREIASGVKIGPSGFQIGNNNTLFDVDIVIRDGRAPITVCAECYGDEIFPILRFPIKEKCSGLDIDQLGFNRIGAMKSHNCGIIAFRPHEEWEVKPPFNDTILPFCSDAPNTSPATPCHEWTYAVQDKNNEVVGTAIAISETVFLSAYHIFEHGGMNGKKLRAPRTPGNHKLDNDNDPAWWILDVEPIELASGMETDVAIFRIKPKNTGAQASIKILTETPHLGSKVQLYGAGFGEHVTPKLAAGTRRFPMQYFRPAHRAGLAHV